MKLRILFSFITIFLSWVTQSVFHMLYSPITGAATAQSLNEDSGVGYATAKFVREGNVSTLIIAVTLMVLLLIWIAPICRAFNKNQN